MAARLRSVKRQLVRDVSSGLVATGAVGLLVALTTTALAGLLVAVGLGLAGLLGESLWQRRKRQRVRRTVPDGVHQPQSARSSVPPPRLNQQSRLSLSGAERDALRELIGNGEALHRESAGRDAIARWSGEAASWLEAHGHSRQARRLRSSEPRSDAESSLEMLERHLVDLRVALVENIPQGFDIDLTPLEAIERWMEVEAIPEEQRPSIRETAARYVRAAEAPGSLARSLPS